MASKPSAALIAQLLDDPASATCPMCGETGFYDNRNSPKRGKGPSFKCKNKDCDDGNGFGYGVFARDLPKEEKAASGGTAPRVRATSAQLKACYKDCLAFTMKAAEYVGSKGVPMTGEAVASMTATLFIAHTNAGAFGTPAAAPAPVAPKPKPPAPPAPDEDPDDYDPSTIPF